MKTHFLKTYLYRKCKFRLIHVDSVTKPSKCGVYKVQDGDERNQVDGDVGDQFDRHGSSVTGRFYDVVLCSG